MDAAAGWHRRIGLPCPEPLIIPGNPYGSRFTYTATVLVQCCTLYEYESSCEYVPVCSVLNGYTSVSRLLMSRQLRYGRPRT
eukprot:scaffold263637_cov30-Prasinocladus_malaysianus.AAC.1